jgi:GIY-YIG catalytic domain
MNKELNKLYKEFKNNPSIYIIEYIPTGEKYVGSTNKLRYRINTHVKDLSLNRHHNINIQNLFNKDKDFNNFKFTCFKEFSQDIDKKELLIILEKEEQQLIDSGIYTLNILKDASVNRKLGYSYDEIYGKEKAKEVRQKIIESNKRRKLSEETKKRISESLLGRTYEEMYEDKEIVAERKYKCGNAFRGKKRPEHSIKMKEICKKKKEIKDGKSK